MKKSLFITFFVLMGSLLAGSLFGAEITVPSVEVASRGGTVDNDNFGISSSLAADFSVTGGYKYGITLGLGMEVSNLEKALSYGRLDPNFDFSSGKTEEFVERYNNQAVLSFRSLKATAREVFDKPLEINFFIGHNDKLGSGDEFPELFGTAPLGTGLKGFFYYPEGLNNDPFFRFNGAIHSIKGTGLSLKAVLGNFVPSLYIYSDLSFPEGKTADAQGKSYYSGHYSADARLLINQENIKIEAFLGGTYRNDKDPILRGGALAWFGTNAFGLLMQAGITYWEFGETLGLDNCYFLVEPQLRFGTVGANLTLFYHPLWYQNRIIYEKDDNTIKDDGRVDVNLRLFYNDTVKSAFTAGVETRVNLKMEDKGNFDLWVSPFFSTATSGMLWDFMVRIKPKNFPDKKDLMDVFIGIRTAF